MILSSFVWVQYQRVTDRQTDTRRTDGIAVAITQRSVLQEMRPRCKNDSECRELLFHDLLFFNSSLIKWRAIYFPTFYADVDTKFLFSFVLYKLTSASAIWVLVRQLHEINNHRPTN